MDKLQVLEDAFTDLANAIHQSNRLLDWSEAPNSQGSDLATWSYYEFTRGKAARKHSPYISRGQREMVPRTERADYE